MLRMIEYRANEAVARNLPVKITWPSKEELMEIPYRSKKEIDGPIRIVEIPGYDICACCAPHVHNTGEIGIESHGAQRLTRYHKGIASGMIKVHAKPEIVFETPVSAVVDGHDGMGQLIGHFAMELAIKKAKETGMAIVSVRDSNHFGIAGSANTISITS